MTGVPLRIPLGVVAPFIGSFLGVLVMRLPRGVPVLWGRSRCDLCSQALGPLDLVPLASWLALRGRCRFCAGLIDPVCPLAELGALGVVLWAATVLTGGLFAASCVFGWLLLALALTDLRTLTLPDSLNATLFAYGIVTTALFMPGQLEDHLIGAALGLGALLLVAWLYRRLRKREGLGPGDAKLLGALGAWVSWEGLAGVVLEAAAMGLVAILAARLWSGKPLAPTAKVPFGAFLAAGGWLVWLYGPLVAR